MAWAAPATIANDVIDRLNVVASSVPLNEHALEQIAFQALKLKNVDLALYHSVMGMIACIRNDSAALDAHFLAAKRAAEQGNSECGVAEVVANFAVSYADIGDFERTRELIIEVARQHPHATDSMRLLCSLAITTGLLDVYMDWFRKFGDDVLDHSMAWGISQLSERGVSAQEAGDFFRSVHIFMAEHGVRRSSVMVMPMNAASEEGPCMMLRFDAPITPNEAADLEDELSVYLRKKALKATERYALIAEIVPTTGEAGADDPRRPAATG